MAMHRLQRTRILRKIHRT